MEDDKRFIKSGDEDNRPDKKKIPLDLGGIELPFQKKAEPPKEEKTPERAAPEIKPEPEAKPEMPPAPPREAPKADEPGPGAGTSAIERMRLEIAKMAEKITEFLSSGRFSETLISKKDALVRFFASGKKTPFMLIGYILSAFLCVSLLMNAFLVINISLLKKRVQSDARVVESVVSGKQSLEGEKESLRAEIKKLERDLIMEKSASENMNAQNQSLKDELTRTKGTIVDMQEKLAKYTKDMRDLATKRVKTYDDYLEEKENTKKLEEIIGKLQQEIESLKGELGSIDARYQKRMAAHIYDMAFLYAKANMFNDAIDSFEKYMEILGEDANIHYNLAFIYENAKADRKQAIAHYKKYLSMKPEAEDLFEVKSKIASLERTSKGASGRAPMFKINLDNLKY